MTVFATQGRAQQLSTIRPDVPAPVLKVLLQWEDSVARVDDTLLIPQEKQRQRQELTQETRTALDTLSQSLLAEAVKEFDQEEGAARAAAKGQLSFPAVETSDTLLRRLITEVHHDRRLRALDLDVQRVAQLTTAAELELAFEDCMLVDDVDVIGRLGAAIATRAGSLADEQRRAAASKRQRGTGSVDPDLLLKASQIQDAFAAWKRQHPTPAERLRAVANARSKKTNLLQHEIAEAIRFVLR